MTSANNAFKHYITDTKHIMTSSNPRIDIDITDNLFFLFLKTNFCSLPILVLRSFACSYVVFFFKCATINANKQTAFHYLRTPWQLNNIITENSFIHKMKNSFFVDGPAGIYWKFYLRGIYSSAYNLNEMDRVADFILALEHTYVDINLQTEYEEWMTGKTKLDNMKINL